MASNHNVLSVGELQEWLNKKADIEEVKLTDFSDAFAKMLNYNALNCLLNNGAITDSTQLKFRLYHLRNTDQNAPYYNIPDSDSSSAASSIVTRPSCSFSTNKTFKEQLKP